MLNLSPCLGVLSGNRIANLSPYLRGVNYEPVTLFREASILTTWLVARSEVEGWKGMAERRHSSRSGLNDLPRRSDPEINQKDRHLCFGLRLTDISWMHRNPVTP
jgi:hypothetical protein